MFKNKKKSADTCGFCFKSANTIESNYESRCFDTF